MADQNRIPSKAERADNEHLGALDVTDVDLNALIVPTDLQVGQNWPPPRHKYRQMRMQRQYAAATGKFGALVSSDRDRKRLTVRINRIGAFIDRVAALMLMMEPKIADDEQRARVMVAIENIVVNCMRHGRSLAIYAPELPAPLIVPDSLYVWPFEPNEDGTQAWAMVQPYMSTETRTAQYDRLRILVWENGVMKAYVHKWGGGLYNSIGDRIEDESDDKMATGVSLAVIDRPPIEAGWGQAAVDDLIEPALALAMRESGVSHVVNRNERAPMYFKATKADITKAIIAMNAPIPEGKTLKPAEATKALNDLFEETDGLILVPELVEAIDYLINDMKIDASFQVINHVLLAMAEITGFAVQEAGDAGTESGISAARRQWFGMARTLRLKYAVHAGLQELIDDFGWGWIGDDDSGDGPAADAAPDDDEAVPDDTDTVPDPEEM